MRRAVTVSVLLGCASVLAFAETWTGKLVDASCIQQQSDAACVPTSSTAVFAFQVSGKTFKLDAEGNRKVAAALKESNNSADRAKDPNATTNQVTAMIRGTLNEDEITVQSIELR